MKVRAKFVCERLEHLPTGQVDETNIAVAFRAVYANGEANREWSKWTPAGQLTMSITNPDAANWFELGKEYFLDITPAE